MNAREKYWSCVHKRERDHDWRKRHEASVDTFLVCLKHIMTDMILQWDLYEKEDSTTSSDDRSSKDYTQEKFISIYITHSYITFLFENFTITTH
jgi:hypothetical protein